MKKIFWLGRPDGVLVKGLPLGQQFMPFMVRRRSEAVNNFEHEIDVTELEQYALSYKARSNIQISVFGFVLRALGCAFHEYPGLNRYVSGRRIYQRNGVDITFSGRRPGKASAGVYLRKRRFDRGEKLNVLGQSLSREVGKGRGGDKLGVERKMEILLRLPWPVVSVVLWFVHLFDDFNLLPHKMVLEDPFYASAFVANLGSIGIRSAYHCMYEHGVIPLVVAVGEVIDKPVLHYDGSVEIKRMMTLSYSYDGRAGDGWECARFIHRVKQFLEQPQFLENPDINISEKENTEEKTGLEIAYG